MNRRSDDQLFCEAIECATHEEQIAWLKETCIDDSQQLERVLQLLATHHQLNTPASDAYPSFLERAGEVFQVLCEEQPYKKGDSVANYVINEKIGEGGMGLVYSAVQTEPMQRDVALKILRPGLRSHRWLLRFGREYDLLARLDHPGIARLLDLGRQPSGLPFYAMELVRNAMPITTYCERKNLGLRHRVELLSSVCNAIQYAHRRGIIHRDIKPSNILIDGGDEVIAHPKVIDFGIAKIIDEESRDTKGITRFGEQFGTPTYMSPEQMDGAEGDVDVRSDVYALGIILFELLTGTVPERLPRYRTPTKDVVNNHLYIPSRRLREMRRDRINTEVDTEKTAVTWSPNALVGDLDWITSKALAFAPDDRYQSMADFQRDLNNYLAGRAVEAAGTRSLYRARKFFIRHRYAASAGLSIVLAISVASTVSTWFAIRAMQAEQLLRQQYSVLQKAEIELKTERDAAQAAERSAVRLLKAAKIQSAMDRGQAAFYGEFFQHLTQDSSSDEETSLRLQQFNEQVGIDFFYRPHPKLIVKGDWSWVVPEGKTAATRETIRYSSRHLAAELKKTLSPGTTANRTAIPEPIREKRFTEKEISQLGATMSGMILSELKKVLDSDDLFLAEILDNGALYAIDLGLCNDAKSFAEESIQLWDLSSEHIPNSIQSRLVLVQAHLLGDELAEACSVVAEAERLLQQLPPQTSEKDELQKLAASLRSRCVR